MYTIKTQNESNLDKDMAEQMYVLVFDEGVEDESKMFVISRRKDQKQYELYASDNGDFFYDVEMYNSKIEALERAKQLIAKLNEDSIDL